MIADARAGIQFFAGRPPWRRTDFQSVRRQRRSPAPFPVTSAIHFRMDSYAAAFSSPRHIPVAQRRFPVRTALSGLLALGLLTCTSVVNGNASDQAPNPVRQEMAKLQGKWLVVSKETNG